MIKFPDYDGQAFEVTRDKLYYSEIKECYKFTY